MPFYAINSYEEDLLDRAQQHTLELQLETALEIFQDTLKAQKEKEDERALSLYHQLFKLDVFQFHKHKHIPPSSYRLKGLALKNYGLLLLGTLKEKATNMSSAVEFRSKLTEILQNLLDALELSADDINIYELLHAIAIELGLNRVARLALENIITAENERALSIGESAMSYNSARLLSPRDQYFLRKLQGLIHRLEDKVSLDTQLYKINVPTKWTHNNYDVSWLNSKFTIKSSLQSLMLELNSDETHEDVPIITKDWEVVATALEDAVNGIAKRKSKHIADPYAYSSHPVFSIQFIAPHGDPVLAIEPEKEPQIVPVPDSEEDTDVEMVDPPTENTETRAASVPMEDAPVSESGPESARATVEPSVEVQEAAASPAESATQINKRKQVDFHRISKRVKTQAPEYTLSADFGIADTIFSEHISSYLQLCKLTYPSVVAIFSNTGDATEEHQQLVDFKVLLEAWDDEQAHAFLQTGAPEVNASYSVMQMLDYAAMGSSSDALSSQFVVDPNDVDLYLAGTSAGRSHIQQTRFDLLLALVSSRQGRNPLIIESAFSQKLLGILLTLADSFEPELIERCRQTFNLDYASAAQAIYELYADKYLDMARESRIDQNKSKDQTEKLLLAVTRWRGMSGDALSHYTGTSHSDELNSLLVRHSWVSIFVDQVGRDEPSETMDRFESIRSLLEQKCNELVIDFPNLSSIPSVSVVSANTQISKFRAASVFAKVFVVHDEESDTEQSIRLLEAMLMPETYKTEIPEYQAISQFLTSASLEFKLSLWYMLLENYQRIGQKQKSRDGLMKIMRSALDELYGPEFASKTRPQRERSILQALSISYDIGKRLLRLLTDDQNLVNELTMSECREFLQHIISLLQVLHIFMLTDQAINSNLIQAPQHQLWDAAVLKLRELLVFGWSLFYLFFRFSIPVENRTSEVLNDILSIVHEQLGTHGYCSLGDGVLLSININEMLRLNWPESEADMLQCLNCRFGITLATEYFTPYNHHAVPTELSSDDAVKLSNFIMNMVLSKKHLTQTILRSDIRQVIETFYEAVGNPDSKLPAIMQNQEVIDRYLKTKLGLTFLKQAYNGTLNLSLFPCDDPKVTAVANGGIYFVMGLVHLSQYRIKKRTNPDKTEDLIKAIDFYKYDLIYNTNRFESWVGLSQAFDALSEVSLIWSPDMHQGNPENPSAIEYQRQAILCACMATSLLLQSSEPQPLSKEFYESLKAQVWSYFGKLLFYSASSPCNMMAYNKNPQKTLVYIDNKFSERSKSPVSKTTILKLSYQALSVGEKYQSNEWFTMYLISKVLFQLKGPPKETLDAMVKARELRATSDARERNQEAVLEPNQAIITMARYFCETDMITATEAIDYFRKSTFLKENDSAVDTPTIDKTLVDRLAIVCLKRLQAADKKHWLHRPVYWLARYYLDRFNAVDQAKEELSELFSLKVNSKSPVQIWKPEIERPGQHFVYLMDYIELYADLLYRSNDDGQLGVLARKFRRFTAVSEHQRVWEVLCNLGTRLAKVLIGFPSKYTEKAVPQLNPDEFEARSEELEAWFSSQKAPDAVLNPWALGLDYAMELRKLNNGYGSTAAVDELVICMYLAVFELFKPFSVFAMTSNLVPANFSVISVDPSPAPSGPPGPDDGNSATTTVFTGVSTSLNPTIHVEGAADDKKGAKKRTRVIRRDIILKAQQIHKILSTKLNTKSEVRAIPSELYDLGASLELGQDRPGMKATGGVGSPKPPSTPTPGAMATFPGQSPINGDKVNSEVFLGSPQKGLFRALTSTPDHGQFRPIASKPSQEQAVVDKPADTVSSLPTKDQPN